MTNNFYIGRDDLGEFENAQKIYNYHIKKLQEKYEDTENKVWLCSDKNNHYYVGVITNNSDAQIGFLDETLLLYDCKNEEVEKEPVGCVDLKFENFEDERFAYISKINIDKKFLNRGLADIVLCQTIEYFINDREIDCILIVADGTRLSEIKEGATVKEKQEHLERLIKLYEGHGMVVTNKNKEQACLESKNLDARKVPITCEIEGNKVYTAHYKAYNIAKTR